jgi:hypothetical protein
MYLIRNPPTNKIIPLKPKHDSAFTGGLNFKPPFLDLHVFLLELFYQIWFWPLQFRIFIEKMVQIHQISKKNSKSLEFYD